MKLRQKLIYPAAAGALYAVLTVVLSPISYGPVQCRVSEALCVLPFFLPECAVGLALGCAAANAFSAAGLPDVLVGAAATLTAGLLTARLGRTYRRTGVRPSFGRRLAAAMMPVIVNALLVGAMLAALYMPRGLFAESWLLFGAQVAAGETAAMLTLGVPFMRLIPRLLHTGFV